MIDQLILQFSQLSLSFQMCFANSVRLAYFLLRNDSLYYVYRCLNVPSVSPMQFFPVSSLPVVTLALYITLVRIFSLRLLMMLPMFGMQLQLTFTFFLLKTGYRLWFGGKCFLIRLWKVLATLVRTSLQYGGQPDDVSFSISFRGCGCVFLQQGRFALNPLDLRAFLIYNDLEIYEDCELVFLQLCRCLGDLVPLIVDYL